MSFLSEHKGSSEVNLEGFLILTYFIFFMSLSIYHLVQIKLQIIGLIFALFFFVAIIPIIGLFVSIDVLRIGFVLIPRLKDNNNKTLKHDVISYYLFKYANNSIKGFIFIISIAFIIGYFLEKLTFVTLITLFFVYNIFHLISYITHYFREETSVLPSVSRLSIYKFCKDNYQIYKVVLIILIILVIPRIPLLLFFGGIGVADTWQILALASNIVYTGKIGFLESMFGIFELIPSEKAVVAPLSLAIISIISDISPLIFFPFYVLWLGYLGFIFFMRFLILVLQHIDLKISKKSISLVSFAGSTMYSLFPYVVIRNISFFSGRSLFIVFFPLLLIILWQWLNKRIKNYEFVLKGLIFSFFLLICHRISLLILGPFFLFCFSWKLFDEKLRNNLTVKRYMSHSIVIYFLLYSELIVIIVRFIFDMFISKNTLSEGWRRGTSFHLQIIKLPLIKELLNLLPQRQYDVILYYLQTWITITFWMGIAALLFLLGLIYTPILIKRNHQKKQISTNFLIFYLMLKICLALNFFILLVDPEEYFFQSVIPIIIFNSIITGYLMHESWFNSQLKKKLVFCEMFLKKTPFNHASLNHYLIAVMIIMLLQATIYMNTFVIVEYTRREEPDTDYISNEIIELANYFKQFPDLYNASIINGYPFPYLSSLGLRLSVLLPWIKFIPSHPTLYRAYGYLDSFTYHFPSLNYAMESIINQKYQFLYYPGFGNKEEYYSLIFKIDSLFNSDISSNDGKNLVKYFNAKMIIIPKSLIQNNDLPVLYQSTLDLYEHVYENSDFVVFHIHA